MASISQRSNGKWRVQIRTAGQPSISRDFDTRKEAVAWNEGAYPVPVAEPVAPALTMADLMDRYSLEVSPGKKGARWEVIRIMALLPYFKTIAVTDLTVDVFVAWRNMRSTQVSASTVIRELNLLSAILTHAISEWSLKIAANPVRSVRRPKSPNDRTRRVSDAERAAILAALGWDGVSPPATIAQWVAWEFCFALETMMRDGEMLKLTWGNVHPKYVHLPDTKNGDPRDVPLNSRARALLALLPPGQPDEGVCVINKGTRGVYFRKACATAGIKDMHFHDSRREALSRTAKKLDMLELMRAVGHRDTRSLGIYYQTDADALADKLD